MRIGVLGCGSIGLRLSRCLSELGHNNLILYDPAPAARQAVAEQLGRPCCATLEEVWAQEPEVALITSPSCYHVPLARAAVAHGCHLFIEKPLSDKSDDVELLCHEASQKGLVSMVGCNMRFHQGPAKVKQLIERNAVGRILSARLESGSYLPLWRPWQNFRESITARKEMGGGAILECIHEIDLARWFFGDGRLAAAVTRKADVLGLDVEGIAEILVSHAAGTVASIHLNILQRNYHRTCQIIGENGTIYWSFQNPWIEVHDGSQLERIELNPQWQTNQMYVDEMDYFLRHVEARQETFCSLEAGFASLKIALAAKLTAENAVRRLDRPRKVRKTVAIIQARMASTRLPGKVLQDIAGKPMLQRVADRVRRAKLLDQVVVATSENPSDDLIENFCKANGVDCFRGSEEDVLDRYFQAALRFQADVIVRVTADCPLIDPEIIEKVVVTFRNGAFDYVSNFLHRSFPDGLDTEVFSHLTLTRAWREARWKSEREHVTSYIYRHPELFQLGNVTSPNNDSDLRWTVDRPQDLEFVRAIYQMLRERPFGMDDVLALLRQDPQLQELNSGIFANEGYFKSLAEDQLLQPREEAPQ